MKRLYEVMARKKNGPLTPLDPRAFFEYKEGKGGAKEFRDTQPIGSTYVIVRGPDHERFTKRGGVRK